MNDFTKEELEDLFDCCKAAYISGEINPQKPLQFKEKIQSMIDNYCEHENSKRIDGFVRDKTDYTNCNHEWDNVEYATSIVTPTIICIKCQAIHFVRDNNDNQ